MIKKILLILLIIIIAVFSVSCNKNSDNEYGVNLLKGSDFEGDLYDDWQREDWVKDEGFTEVEVVSDRDSQSLKIISTNLNDAKLKQKVNVEEKQLYKLSGYIKTENVKEGAGANLSFNNTFVYTESIHSTTDGYTYVELYGRTEKKQKSVTIFARLGGYSSESLGVAYFDDIRFEMVEKAPKGANIYSLKENEQKSEKVEETEKVKFSGSMLFLSILFIIAFVLIKQSIDYGDGLEKRRRDFIYPYAFAIILLLGFVIRLILAIVVSGYPNDMGCWQAWASIAARDGLVSLYNGDVFIDYPPGYMYILYVVGWVMRIPAFADMAHVLVKIPPIIADIVLSIIIYKMAERKLSSKVAIMLASLYYLSPAIITDSAAWGQIDSILAIMAVLYVAFLYRRDFVLGGICLGVGVLLKPQMLFFAPIYILAAYYYLRDVYKKIENGVDEETKIKRKTNIKTAWGKIGKGVGAGLLAFIIIVLPFEIKYGSMFIIDLYIETISSYSTASLNACNIWALVGGMWEHVDTKFLGATYGFWGYVGMVVSVVIFGIVSFRDKDKKNIFFHAALLVTGLFLLSGKMHERYMYAAMALLIVSYIYTKRRDHFVLFCFFSVTQFANISLVLANKYIYSDNIFSILATIVRGEQVEKMLGDKVGVFITMAISIITIIGYIYMLYVGVSSKKAKQNEIEAQKIEEKRVLIEETKERVAVQIKSKKFCGLKKLICKRDLIIIGVITLVYSIIAFINLGDNYAPQTLWNANMSDKEVIVDFGEDVEIGKIMFYRAQGTNGAHFTVDFASSNVEDEYYSAYYYRIDEESNKETMVEQIKEEFSMFGDNPAIEFSNYPAVFKWYTMESLDIARYAKITIHRPMIRLGEVVFIDTQGNTIPIKDIIINDPEANDALNLFDEQNTVPEKRTYMNSTYFDEIYHAGTAWEHIMGYEPYETTHPPLGKVIMSIGIRIFGMTPFGWRIMGTIIGILMIPAIYLLAMVIFKKTRYAAIATMLMTFDFMHFTQTRIATIDSYSVFFIILMFLFMGIYYRMSFYKHKFIKTLIPLFLSGVFFGLGAASKWICIYAGAGLAIIFFYTLYKRYREYVLVRDFNEDRYEISQEKVDFIKAKFKKYTLITIALCIVFFIIIPVCIYSASYIPILQVEEGRGLEYVVDSQVNMYNYHSNLDSTHGYASPWYEWPLMIKPMWYYLDDTIQNTGRMSSIAAFGNPAVWWVGTISILWLLINMLKKKKEESMQTFILIAWLAQFLPWVFVPRSMFIYHYFASIPFIIMMITMMIRELEKSKWYKKRYTYIYLGVVIALFAFFYPVISGAEISSEYGRMMQWMPQWWFLY